MQVDLHGMELVEAQEELYLALQECVAAGDPVLEVIHGHSHGQVLRNYVRSPAFPREMAILGFPLQKLSGATRNPGVTVFRVGNVG